MNLGLRLALLVRWCSWVTRLVLCLGLVVGRLRAVPRMLIVRAAPNCLVSR